MRRPPFPPKGFFPEDEGVTVARIKNIRYIGNENEVPICWISPIAFQTILRWSHGPVAKEYGLEPFAPSWDEIVEKCNVLAALNLPNVLFSANDSSSTNTTYQPSSSPVPFSSGIIMSSPVPPSPFSHRSDNPIMHRPSPQHTAGHTHHPHPHNDHHHTHSHSLHSHEADSAPIIPQLSMDDNAILSDILHSNNNITSNDYPIQRTMSNVVSLVCPNPDCGITFAIDEDFGTDESVNTSNVPKDGSSLILEDITNDTSNIAASTSLSSGTLSPSLPVPTVPLPRHLTCPACTKTLCGTCGHPWVLDATGTGHAGKTCAEYSAVAASGILRARVVKDILSNSLGSGAKLCPNPNCGAIVVRYRGHRCHHVTCAKCRLRFCYCCLCTDAEEGDVGHENSCPTFCDDTCGCVPCPTCADGPSGRTRCKEMSGESSCDGAASCTSCALGNRLETEQERTQRLANEEKCTARHKKAFPLWPGPRRVRDEHVKIDAESGGSNIWTWAYFRRTLDSSAALVREATQLLDTVIGSTININEDIRTEMAGYPAPPTKISQWLASLNPGMICTIEEGLYLLTRAAIEEVDYPERTVNMGTTVENSMLPSTVEINPIVVSSTTVPESTATTTTLPIGKKTEPYPLYLREPVLSIDGQPCTLVHLENIRLQRQGIRVQGGLKDRILTDICYGFANNVDVQGRIPVDSTVTRSSLGPLIRLARACLAEPPPTPYARAYSLQILVFFLRLLLPVPVPSDPLQTVPNATVDAGTMNAASALLVLQSQSTTSPVATTVAVPSTNGPKKELGPFLSVPKKLTKHEEDQFDAIISEDEDDEDTYHIMVQFLREYLGPYLKPDHLMEEPTVGLTSTETDIGSSNIAIVSSTPVPAESGLSSDDNIDGIATAWDQVEGLLEELRNEDWYGLRQLLENPERLVRSIVRRLTSKDDNWTLAARLSAERSIRRVGWATELLSLQGVGLLSLALEIGYYACQQESTVTSRPGSPSMHTFGTKKGIDQRETNISIGETASQIIRLLSKDDDLLAVATGYVAWGIRWGPQVYIDLQDDDNESVRSVDDQDENGEPRNERKKRIKLLKALNVTVGRQSGEGICKILDNLARINDSSVSSTVRTEYIHPLLSIFRDTAKLLGKVWLASTCPTRHALKVDKLGTGKGDILFTFLPEQMPVPKKVIQLANLRLPLNPVNGFSTVFNLWRAKQPTVSELRERVGLSTGDTIDEGTDDEKEKNTKNEEIDSSIGGGSEFDESEYFRDPKDLPFEYEGDDDDNNNDDNNTEHTDNHDESDPDRTDDDDYHSEDDDENDDDDDDGEEGEGSSDDDNDHGGRYHHHHHFHFGNSDDEHSSEFSNDHSDIDDDDDDNGWNVETVRHPRAQWKLENFLNVGSFGGSRSNRRNDDSNDDSNDDYDDDDEHSDDYYHDHDDDDDHDDFYDDDDDDDHSDEHSYDDDDNEETEEEPSDEDSTSEVDDTFPMDGEYDEEKALRWALKLSMKAEKGSTKPAGKETVKENESDDNDAIEKTNPVDKSGSRGMTNNQAQTTVTITKVSSTPKLPTTTTVSTSLPTDWKLKWVPNFPYTTLDKRIWLRLFLYPSENDLPILHSAALGGNVQIVEKLLQYRLSVNAKDGFGTTPMMIAAREGNTDVMTVLHAHEADTEITDQYGWSALYYAVIAGKFEAVKLLVEWNEALLHITDHNSNNILHTAVRWRNNEIISLLLSRMDSDQLNAEMGEGLTPLGVACTYGSLSTIDCLLKDSRININNTDSKQRTAIMHAAKGGRDSIVLALIERGADYLGTTERDKSLLCYAARHCQTSTVESLINIWPPERINEQNNEKYSALAYACKSSNLATVKALHKAGALLDFVPDGTVDLNGINRRGNAFGRPVQILTDDHARMEKPDSLEILKYLLDNQVSLFPIKYQSYTFTSPIFTAIYSGAVAAVKELLPRLEQLPATVFDFHTFEDTDERQNILLYSIDMVLRERDNDTHNTILGMIASSSKVNLNVPWGSENKLPLFHILEKLSIHTASSYVARASTAIETLIRAGADVNIQESTTMKRTPLLYACQMQRPLVTIINLLLNNHADTSIADNEGRTPLMYILNKLSTDDLPEDYIQESIVAILKTYNGRPFTWREECWRNEEYGNILLALLTTEMEEASMLFLNLYPTVAQKYINSRDREGDTPLSLAARFENSGELIRILRQYGATVNSVDNDNVTPLMHACMGGYANAVRELLVQPDGADYRMEDSSRQTALLFAAEYGEIECVRMLLDAGDDIEKAGKYSSMSVLGFAVDSGNIDVVNLLLERGAKVDHTNFSQPRPLEVAIRNGDASMLRRLLLVGANPTLRDHKNRTPLMLIASRNDLGKLTMRIMIKLILANRKLTAEEINGEYSNTGTVLHYLCTYGVGVEEFIHAVKDYQLSVCPTVNMDNSTLAEIIRPLLNVNARDEDGITPLMAACLKGNLDIIKLLVEAGADLNAKDNRTASPLNYAIQRKRTKTVRYFLDNYSTVDVDGTLPNASTLLYAIHHNSFKIFRLLVEHGANINCLGRVSSLEQVSSVILGNETCTPLVYACRRNTMEIIEYLLERTDIVIDKMGTDKRSALMEGVWTRNWGIVRLLLEKNANPSFKDKNKKTVLDYPNIPENIKQLLNTAMEPYRTKQETNPPAKKATKKKAASANTKKKMGFQPKPRRGGRK